MPLVSDSQMAALRNLANKGLDTAYTVWRRTRAETVYGMEDGEPTQVYEGVCWLRMMNQPFISEGTGMKSTQMSRYRMHTTRDADIAVDDEIRVSDQENYIVQDVNTDDTVQIFRTAILRRVE